MLKTEAFVMGWVQAQAARLEGSSAGKNGQQAAASWCHPTAGMLKLNVDAAVRDGFCVLGWCLRDDEGKFVAGVARKRHGRFSALEAELIGIREALSWLRESGWRTIEVESDASQVISKVLKGSSISFSHVRRSANKAAHAIAKAACSLSDSQSWFTIPPLFISFVIDNDLINVN
ncbi:unnamed protein product [Cuscuta europaea]|uniref:RNase H type-1 domain-containing protein n=1 Tax=Cuscuta europaea TaxID=41803 RepID=A0A9P1EGB0_CUSEU|nr:unnamed protein product [Cuscuta europaea]